MKEKIEQSQNEKENLTIAKLAADAAWRAEKIDKFLMKKGEFVKARIAARLMDDIFIELGPTVKNSAELEENRLGQLTEDLIKICDEFEYDSGQRSTKKFDGTD